MSEVKYMQKFFKWLGIVLGVLALSGGVWGYFYIYKPFVFIEAALNNDIAQLEYLHKEKGYSFDTKIISTNANAITFIIVDNEKKPDIKTITYLLEKGADVEAVSSNGISNLNRAILNKQSDIARLLIKYGADINSYLNKEGDSAAVIGAYVSGQYDFAQELLNMGAKASPELQRQIQEKLSQTNN